MKRGLVLLNLGTPASPDPADVGRYLTQFLMDRRVIDISWPLRWFLVNVLIVPRRKHASGRLYQTVWTQRGSPLLFHLQDLAAKVAPMVASTHETVIAMRYGEPSIERALGELASKGIRDVDVFPLYPQYAESSTLSSIEECGRVAEGLGLKLSFQPAFYDHPGFIAAFAARVREVWERDRPEHLLISFHGLPERQVKRTDRSGGQHCFQTASCCDQIVEANRDCYRAQCFATARAIAIASGLAPDQYTVSFQSRLGRTPWIKPYTDFVIPELAARGIRRLAVVCPSFVADCLETLEEIEGRAAEQFIECGGKSFNAIACVNSDDAWAKTVAEMISG